MATDENGHATLIKRGVGTVIIGLIIERLYYLHKREIGSAASFFDPRLWSAIKAFRGRWKCLLLRIRSSLLF